MVLVPDHSDNELQKRDALRLPLVMKKELECKIVYMDIILTHIRCWDQQQISLNRLYSPGDSLNSNQQY